SIAGLLDTLNRQPSEQGLTRALIAEDMTTLEVLARDSDVAALAQGRAAVERLWEVCGLPDYRKISPMQHAELATTLYLRLMRHDRLDADWYARQLASLDRTDGEIDTLSARIAQVRTWTYVANRPDWLPDPEHWQGMARLVEDKLSDALHERLASRFVDRRTSVLMRRLRENAMLEAEVTAAGDVLVEGQHVGLLQGFRFTADPKAGGPEAKALNAAAMKALASEMEARASRVVLAGDEAFVLSHDGFIRWVGEPVARLVAGEKVLEPRLRLLVEEHLTGPAREQVENRLTLWLKNHITKLLGPLQVLEEATSLTGIARGIAFQAAEALGVLERAKVGEEMKTLDQEGRAGLRQLGMRFGAFHLYVPALLKPAPRALAAQLWALKHDGPEQGGLDDIAHLASSGRTSFPANKDVPKGLYRAAGYRVCGERAVRVDILERLADLIRPAIAYRPGVTLGQPPAGAADQDGFVATGAMTSLVGCAGEDFASILRSLGYVSVKRAGPAITVPLAATPEPIVAAPATELEAAPAGEGEVATETVAAESPDALDAEAPSEAPASEGEAPEATLSETPDAPVFTEAEIAAAPGEAIAATAEAEQSDMSEPAPAEAAASEAPASAAPAEEPAKPAEPELIEVWRPHRHQGGRRPEQGARGRRQDRRPGQQGAAAPAGDAGGGPRPEGGQRPNRNRWREGGWNGQRPAAAGQAPAADAAGGAPERQGRGGRPEGGNRPERGPRPEFRRNEGRPGGGPRRDERGGKEQRFQAPAKPRAAERQPDPDSPFAKLLALKAQLEGGDGRKG
ncbi:MAG: helicase, partial [Bosea sp.]|nr:helicase [Bosea sp. (in: a-proteobacteria)]